MDPLIMLPHQTNSSKLINQPTESEHSAGIQENILKSKQLFKLILLYSSLVNPIMQLLVKKNSEFRNITGSNHANSKAIYPANKKIYSKNILQTFS